MTTTTPSARLLILPGLLLSLAIGAEQRRVADLDLSVQESDITPSVTLREHENRAVEEYRVNNNLYMVKITPAAGAPYYLVDDDGSGDMQWRRDPGDRTVRVPQWALIRW
jgi:hypothetical protein